MTKIWELKDIKRVLPEVDVISAMADAFAAYSSGSAIVPPVGELLFEDPPGDLHIKYGYLKNDRWSVVKIASGFYKNPLIGLPANSGVMLIFGSRTGQLHTILLDEGHLTNVRTAAAGAYAAQLLAPKNIERIGIIGSGEQARMQLEMLHQVTPCRNVSVYARNVKKAQLYAAEMIDKGYDVEIELSAGELASKCNLIVTTTASHDVHLKADDIRPGTHITAMGSDTPEKNELDPGVLAMADTIAADSIVQCRERGEIHHALKAGAITLDQVKELGTLSAADEGGLRSDTDITIADLTGVAVQDIEISKAVMALLAAEEDRELL